MVKQRNLAEISLTRHEALHAEKAATYVLVHGAWHGSWCWKRVRKPLQDAGHQVFTPTLTCLGERSHLNSSAVNLSTHIADVINLVRWEDLSNVILCGHSYGGLVISGVADKAPERIGELVYLDAFVPEDGKCLFELQSPEREQQMRLQAHTAGAGWKVPPIPAERFNVNLEDVAWVNAQCTAQSIASFEERIRLNRVWHEATHILATGWDHSSFRTAHERAKTKGWRTVTVASGHEVMLDSPAYVAGLLLDFALRAGSSLLA